MSSYEVSFECMSPEWPSVIVDADDEIEAEELALKEVSRLFPEAIDFIVIDTKEII